MSKLIGFIPGIAEMRGNISGSQNLEYPTNDNKAYAAPDGKHFATNYKPRYIACKRASDGLTYFQVKQRSAIKNTAASRLAMAALGAAGSLSAVLLENEVYRPALEAEYAARKAAGRTSAKSFRAWLVEVYRVEFLKKGSTLQVITGEGTMISFNNPFNTTQYDPAQDITLPMEILAKFWSVLCSNPIFFTVSGLKAVAHSGDTFTEVVNGNYNNLGLAIEPETHQGELPDNLVKLGDLYIWDGIDSWINKDDEVDPSIAYQLKVFE